MMPVNNLAGWGQAFPATSCQSIFDFWTKTSSISARFINISGVSTRAICNLATGASVGCTTGLPRGVYWVPTPNRFAYAPKRKE